jgi:hypothetical protein
MKQYGAPYMGSKSKIAEDILAVLPRGKRFVDLFGGGFAMTHCAMLSGKYEEFYYNELNPLVVDMIKKAIDGEYKNERRWIDRETFFNLKEKDGYIKYCWSFGNNGDGYLYAKEIEPWKKALHYARVLGDCSLLKEFGIDSNGSRQDISAHKEEYKEKYIKWYLKDICLSDADFNRLKKDLDKKIKDQKEELRQYLCNALKESGLTAAEVDRRLNTQMSRHYFGHSQWQFPTREEYNKMRAFMPLKPYDEIYGYQELLQSLQSLERLQSLELHCGSYVDYQHKVGDVVYCFDDETELLTKRGWVNVANIKKDDELLSREPNTARLEYIKNTKKIAINYTGYMYSYEGKNISINVSENHKLFISRKIGRKKERQDTTITADKAYTSSFQFISAGGIWKGTPEKTIKILGQEFDKIKFARLLGIFLTDGSINKQDNIFIYQTKESIRNTIKNLLIDLNIEFTEHKKYFYLSRKYKGYFKQFYLKEKRKIPQDFKDSNVEVLKSLLEGIIDGDGDNSRRRIYIGSKSLVDDIQEIIYKIGLSSCFYIKEPKQSFLKDENRYIKALKPYFVVSINNKKYLNHIHKNEKRNFYAGKLYCCCLEKWHTVLMRRHGKIIWINQCDPPYENTAKYSEDGFNHKEFYDWVYSRPYRVYFSSYEISDNRFYKVWSKQKIQNLNGQGAGAKVQETVYCNQPDKVMLF